MPDIESEADDVKRKRQRSPAYPFINLETALRRAKEFYEKEVRNAVNIKIAAKHWGYEEKSSGGLQTAATLISFGLLRDEGTGGKRKLQLTQNALRIILDSRPDSRERAAAIKEAALAPKIHQELWKKWGSALPSDSSLKYTLTVEWVPPFNGNAVESFIKEYKDTVAFAKLGESDHLSGGVIEVGDGAEGPLEQRAYVPKVGDYVQWEPGGVLQFQEPKRVSRFSADGRFAFVDGSPTGLPVEELTEEARPLPAVPPTGGTRVASNPPLGRTSVREDVFSLPEGNVTFQWPAPLSDDSIQDLKDWFRILERKISRSGAPGSDVQGSSD
jgi:hypothetical protein